MTTVRMCQIEIMYKDGTSDKHDIMLWDWFQNNFPFRKDKDQVKYVKRLQIYTVEMA